MTKKYSILLVMIILFTMTYTRVGFAEGISGFKEDENIVVSLGKDLTQKQQEEMLELFGVDKGEGIIFITNEEERKYLSSYIDDKVIGTRAISSSYVEKLEENKGIDIETYNINWVTKDMFKNALITAGIKDAKVKVAAPVNVSGTAALTGIIKAFEGVSGIEIGEKEKQVANEEIAKTGKLAEDIGKEKASELIRKVKEEIISEGTKNEEDIKKIIVEITGDLDIKLDDKQLEEIVSLMKNISKLNIDVAVIEDEIKDISENVDKIAKNTGGIKGILQKILDFFKQIFAWLGDIL